MKTKILSFILLLFLFSSCEEDEKTGLCIGYDGLETARVAQMCLPNNVLSMTRIKKMGTIGSIDSSTEAMSSALLRLQPGNS